MGFKNCSLKKCIRSLTNLRGAEMAEAAISLPLIIITAMLLVRTFVFYLEIVSTAADCHAEALEHWDSYSGTGFKVYKSSEKVSLIKGGVLMFDVSKEINTKAYMLNEDLMVRAGEIFK